MKRSVGIVGAAVLVTALAAPAAQAAHRYDSDGFDWWVTAILGTPDYRRDRHWDGHRYRDRHAAHHFRHDRHLRRDHRRWHRAHDWRRPDRRWDRAHARHHSHAEARRRHAHRAYHYDRGWH